MPINRQNPPPTPPQEPEEPPLEHVEGVVVPPEEIPQTPSMPSGGGVGDVLDEIAREFWDGVVTTGKEIIGGYLPDNVNKKLRARGWFDSGLGQGGGVNADQSNPNGMLVAGQDYGLVVILGAEQQGKHLDIETPIATDTGWKTMGTLQLGDIIFDEQGKYTTVEWMSEISTQPCYKLTFDNSDSIIASATHKWAVQSSIDRYHRKPPQIKTTAELVKKVNCRYPGFSSNWSIPLTHSLQTKEAALPIDPYFLGVWLGDGTASGAEITTGDPEIIEYIREAGFDIRPRKAKYEYGIGDAPLAGRKRTPEMRAKSVKSQLRRLGVLDNKHIPQEYLRASENQRLLLLQGLMDTDGTGHLDGSVDFDNTNFRLIQNVIELISSLGMQYRICECHPNCNGHACKSCWSISILSDKPLFRLQRKLERQYRRKPKLRDKNIYIKKIDFIGDKLVRCIGVSSTSHLYLAGKSMIPTHNSTLAFMICKEQADKGKPVFMATSESLPINAAALPRFIQPLNISGPEVLQQLPENACIFIDDCGEYFSNMSYHTKESQTLRTLKNVSAHKRALLVCTVQNIMDVYGVLRRPQILYIKNPNTLFLDHEPVQYRKYLLEAKAKFDTMPFAEKPRWALMLNALTGDKRWIKTDKPSWLTRGMLLNKGGGGSQPRYNPQQLPPDSNSEWSRWNR